MQHVTVSLMEQGEATEVLEYVSAHDDEDDCLEYAFNYLSMTHKCEVTHLFTYRPQVDAYLGVVANNTYSIQAEYVTTTIVIKTQGEH